MIYIVNYIIFACIFLMPSVTLSSQKDDEEQLQSWLKQISSFEAKFTQSTYDQHQGLISKGSGSLQYKRPNLVRWITDYPVEQPREVVFRRGPTRILAGPERDPFDVVRDALPRDLIHLHGARRNFP